MDLSAAMTAAAAAASNHSAEEEQVGGVYRPPLEWSDRGERYKWEV